MQDLPNGIVWVESEMQESVRMPGITRSTHAQTFHAGQFQRIMAQRGNVKNAGNLREQKK